MDSHVDAYSPSPTSPVRSSRAAPRDEPRGDPGGARPRPRPRAVQPVHGRDQMDGPVPRRRLDLGPARRQGAHPMTAAMQKILSADLEALSGVTLEQALLNSTPRRLVDQVEDIVDRLAADRLLIGAIAAYGLEPDTFGPVETDWPEIAYTLQDVAVRLVTALEETRTLVKAD